MDVTDRLRVMLDRAGDTGLSAAFRTGRVTTILQPRYRRRNQLGRPAPRHIRASTLLRPCTALLVLSWGCASPEQSELVAENVGDTNAAADSQDAPYDFFGPKPQLAGIDSVGILIAVGPPSELVGCPSYQGRSFTEHWSVVEPMLAETERQFRTQLERHGVRVSAGQAWSADRPVLNVNTTVGISCMSDVAAGVAWTMTLQVVDDVILVRRPNVRTPGAIWQTSTKGWARVTGTDLSELNSQLLAGVAEVAQAFALEYHRAN